MLIVLLSVVRLPFHELVLVLLDSESADWYVSIRNLAAKTTANDLKEKLAAVAPVSAVSFRFSL